MHELYRVWQNAEIRKFVAAYLWFQGVTAALWWIGVGFVPSFRDLFLWNGLDPVVLQAFLIPDLLLFVIGANVAAWGVSKRARWAETVCLIHAGAAVYAGLYTWALCVMTNSAWISAAFMTHCVLLTPYLVWRLIRED